MISHVHDDHFHLPSLQRLPKTATAVIPYQLDPWMAQTLRRLGFAQVAVERTPEVQAPVLNRGDRLSPTDGVEYVGSGFDWGRRDEAVAATARAQATIIQAALAEEQPPPEDFFERFRAYFTALVRRNRLLRRRTTVPIAFAVEGINERWVVDCTSRQVVRRELSQEAPIEIRVPPTVLFAAIEGEIHWETLYLSNRLRIRVPRDLLDQEWNLWRMAFNFPQGLLRDRLRFLSVRGLRVLRRRYPELTRLALERLRAPSQREPERDI